MPRGDRRMPKRPAAGAGVVVSAANAPARASELGRESASRRGKWRPAISRFVNSSLANQLRALGLPWHKSSVIPDTGVFIRAEYLTLRVFGWLPRPIGFAGVRGLE